MVSSALSINTNGRGIESIDKSVVKEPQGDGFLGDFVFNMASTADDFPAWGTYPALRDRKLREFWPNEPILASAIFTTIARYVAFGWSLKGPDRQVAITERVLHGAEFGQGLDVMLSKVLTDVFTQDNAGWIEMIRTEDDKRAPCIGLKHLDTSRCIRTGRAEEPIIFYDIQGNGHRMKYYQVIEISDMPMPLEYARGMQMCAVSRCLKAAQLIRDMLTYMREKMSGRFHRAVHLVGGVQRQTIADAMAANQQVMDDQGLSRFAIPVIIAALDPTRTVSHEQIDLASLPDGFKFDEHMKWYINQLALAFGADYQDFAPLPGGNLGSAQQSETLHMKSRGKGPRLFMSKLENAFNFHGVMPSTVKFIYGDQDVSEDTQHARLRKLRADQLKVLTDAFIISPQVARQILADFGDLDPKYLAELGDKDLTPDINEEAKAQAAPTAP